MAYSPQQRRQGGISETLEISELTDHFTDALRTRTDLSTPGGQRNYFREKYCQCHGSAKCLGAYHCDTTAVTDCQRCRNSSLAAVSQMDCGWLTPVIGRSCVDTR